MAEHVVTGEVVEVSPDALTEFGSDVGLQRARAVAEQLSGIIRERKLAVKIGTGEHLRVEAWCAAGAMVGLSPRTAWTREARSPDGALEGYDARVEVVRLSTAEVVGAAEAGCFFDEKMKGRPRWTERHQVKSMAQTRATSKALGQVLRWIPVLAGYEGTPAEEMPVPETAPRKRKEPAKAEPQKQPEAPKPPSKSSYLEPIGFGKFAPYTWKDLVEGGSDLHHAIGAKNKTWCAEKPEVGGIRHSWLEWMIGQIEATEDRSERDEQILRYCKVCKQRIENAADEENA